MNCTFDSKFSDLTVLKGDKGDKGDKGEKGDKGDKGAPGKDGASATIYAGTTTTGEPGTQASVVNTGTAQAAVFNFTIPRGDKGEPGHDGTDGDDGYTPQRGVDYWTAADVQTIENYVNEQIVAQGYTLPPATSTTLGGIKVGENLTISSDGTLGAPYAEKGDKGEQGEQGAKGDTGADGKSAYQFAQEAGYTGTEMEFGAKLNQTTFANPFPLTFTGAASATYDGSSAVTIDLPSGGGSVSNYKTVIVVLDADASRVDISKDAEGGALSAHEVYWIALTKSATTSNEKYTILINGGWSVGDPYISPNHTTSKSTDTWYNGAFGHMIVQDGFVLSTNMTQGPGRPNALGVYSKYAEITSVNFVNATFAAGCTFILFYR